MSQKFPDKPNLQIRPSYFFQTKGLCGTSRSLHRRSFESPLLSSIKNRSPLRLSRYPNAETSRATVEVTVNRRLCVIRKNKVRVPHRPRILKQYRKPESFPIQISILERTDKFTARRRVHITFVVFASWVVDL